MEKQYWFSGNYSTVELQMTEEQARSASHQGQCDNDVAALVLELKGQLDRINPESLRKELREYGAWGAKDLADHNQNLQRIVWLAAGNILDDLYLTGKEA